MIYTLTLNPSIDQHITVRKLIPNDKITPENIRLEPGGKGFNVSRVIQELGGTMPEQLPSTQSISAVRRKLVK